MTPPSEGRSKHFTYEFEACAVNLMREVSVKCAGRILSESKFLMSRMLFVHVNVVHAR
jgi:hypothetical protein